MDDAAGWEYTEVEFQEGRLVFRGPNPGIPEDVTTRDLMLLMATDDWELDRNHIMETGTIRFRRDSRRPPLVAD